MGTAERTKMLAALTRALEDRLSQACMVEAVAYASSALALRNSGVRAFITAKRSAEAASRGRERAYTELCNAMQLELSATVFGG
jgi:hypothetical protein